MASSNAPFVVFNGGEIGAETLSRVTLENYAACSETCLNIWLDANGPMSLRPGWQFRGDLGTEKFWLHPFVRSVRERFMLCLGNSSLRIATGGVDADIIARPAVTSAISNGDFATSAVNYITNATLTASSTIEGAPSNLKDGDTSTLWMSNTAATAWVKIDLGSAIALQRIWLSAAYNFPQYAPTSWTFQASATGAFAGEQVTLLTVSASAPYTVSERRQFTFANATAYRYYRINMTVNGNNGTIGSYYKDVLVDPDGIPGNGDEYTVTQYVAGPGGYFRIGSISLPEISGWTDISESGSSIGTDAGRLLLNSNGSAIAGLRQQVATSSPNILHAIDVHVHHGPVTLKVGSVAAGTQYIEERSLRTGHHSLAFVPTGAFWVELTSSAYRQVEVDSVAIAGAGDLVLNTPWAEADHQSLRFHQTRNVMYVARGTMRQRRIERWDNNSWSVTETDEVDGPFNDPNTDDSLRLTPSVRVGNGTLNASRNFFKTGHVGALFRLTHPGQFETRVVSGADQWSEPIEVQGVGGSRALTFTVGTGLTGTVRIQRSIGNTTSWANATTSSSTSGNVSIATSGASFALSFNDGLDNNKVYYRVGVATSEYTSGSATVTIFYAGSSTEGIVRVTNYVSPTQVLMEVLENLAQATATSDWEEGAWSDAKGWPRAVTEFDGRLWTLRSDRFWGSFSGAYESHDRDEGASSAIARDIAVGAANEGQWLVGLGRLIIGTEGAEVVVRSNAFDEPLSTTNMTVREMSTYGVGDVQPAKIDTRNLYVDNSGFHLMEVVYNVQLQDYVARPLTTLHRDIGRPGLTQLSVLRRPDSRVCAVRSDGSILVKLFDPTENVLGWGRWTSPGAGGVIESIASLPQFGENQDELFASIRRTVNGQTRRYFERLGPLYYATKEDACRLDSYVSYSGASRTTFDGLNHLEGQTVEVWADGYNAGTHTVVAGTVTLTVAATKAVIGLPYQGLYKGSKLAVGAKQGTALAQRGRPVEIAFILRKAIRGSIEYGCNFTTMDRLEDRMESDAYGAGPALVTETTDPYNVPDAELQNDPRVCIRFNSPAPAWIDGFVVGHELNERVP